MRGEIMTRQEELNIFLSKLRDKGTFPLEDSLMKEMESFLRHDNDEYTKELQKAIGDELQEDFDSHVSFKEFLEDYADKHPQDTAGYDSLRSKIFGDGNDGTTL
jgi:hypothetical protein